MIEKSKLIYRNVMVRLVFMLIHAAGIDNDVLLRLVAPVDDAFASYEKPLRKWHYKGYCTAHSIYYGAQFETEGIVEARDYNAAWNLSRRDIAHRHPEADYSQVSIVKSIKPPLKGASKKSPGYIYLIRGENNTYKIGLSSNPTKRIKTLGVQLPFQITPIHLIKTDHMLDAEKHLHSMFADKRTAGEWFALDACDVETICAIEHLSSKEVQA